MGKIESHYYFKRRYKYLPACVTV